MVLEMAPRFAGPGQVAAEDKGRQSRKGRQEVAMPTLGGIIMVLFGR